MHKSYNLLIVVNYASYENDSGQSVRYYINGKRTTYSAYTHIELLATRQDSFATRISGHLTRHYKTVYL